MTRDAPTADRDDARLHWNELLHACPDHGAVVDGLVEAQKDAGWILDGRPVCNVVRPRFVTVAEAKQERDAVAALSRALRKVRDAILDDERLCDDYLGGFHDWLGGIMSLEPRFHEAWMILRFDSFTTDAGVRFVEVNGDIPMGSVCNDDLVRIFQDLEFFPAFEERYDVRPSLVQIGMTQTFMHAWQGWGGMATPRICALSLPGGLEEVFARLNARAMRKIGLDVTFATPGNLDFDGGKLRANGRAVDLVYRVIRVADCLERVGELAPLMEAVKHESVCLVNPFQSALMSHKYLFSLLTDDAHDFGFTSSERAAVRACVPWGRILRDGPSTGPDGKPIDLVEYVLAHRDDVVIKPAHDAGGRGVCLGWHCDEGDWPATVEEALERESVVQQKIEPAREEYPLLEKGFGPETFFEDTDPFSFPGGYASVLTRISAAEITNVHLGGSVVPTFVIDAR